MDVVGVLTGSPDLRNYRVVLKHRIKAEGNEMVTICNRLKILAPDRNAMMTDIVDTEQFLRIIQSVLSPKAEPFKRKAVDGW